MLTNGLISGFEIALLALAFQIIYLPTRVFFIALGGFLSLAPYLAQSVLDSEPDAMISALTIASVVIVGLSILCELANHGPLTRRNASDGVHMITSLGIYITIVQCIAMIWGNDTKILRAGLDYTFNFKGGIMVTGAQLVILTTSVMLIGGFAFFLHHSNLGLRLRALADNPTQFALLGYNINYYRNFAFGLGSLFATASSLATAYEIGYSPYAGLHSLLLAVAAIMIGGQSSFRGSVIGSVLIGLLRAEVAWYFSDRWQDTMTFGLLAVFLLLRPQGLIRDKARLESCL